MGINDLLPHLPGGTSKDYRRGFFSLNLAGEKVPLDCGTLLYQCALRCGKQYLAGNRRPAVREFYMQVHYLFFICKWDIECIFDGAENPCKAPERARRSGRADSAKESGEIDPQIRIDSMYIAMAIKVCIFLGIRYKVSAQEADGQTVRAQSDGGIVVTGDSDLLAYGGTKIVLVKSYFDEVFRLVDLMQELSAADADQYPLFGMYKTSGATLFQLYAGCRGCDFTEKASGLPQIGYDAFLKTAGKISGRMTAETLAAILIETHNKGLAKEGFSTVASVEKHLLNVVDAFTVRGMVYDSHGNVCNMDGDITSISSDQTRSHMTGKVDSKSMQPFTAEQDAELEAFQVRNLVHCASADPSKLRGVKLPDGKDRVEDLNVSSLRDMVVVRGGAVTQAGNNINKPELQTIVKQYMFLEEQMEGDYYDRAPGPQYFVNIETGHKEGMEKILYNLATEKRYDSDKSLKDLLKLAYSCHVDGLFDDAYDNIALTAPELRPDLIYKTYGHIGDSIEEKNIGNALQRCWGTNRALYHAMAFVPDSDRVLLLSKQRASAVKDEKTRKETPEGEKPLPKEYVVIHELQVAPTNEITDKHNLGCFVSSVRAYCSACAAGMGECRHRPEALWFQYYHWHPDRPIEKPSTIELCGWCQHGHARMADVRGGITSLQCHKMPKTIEEGEEYLKRVAWRDCTLGLSANYQVHVSAAKQCKLPGRFSADRPAVQNFWKELRKRKHSST